ncbi:hypothetical protein [Streptomyces sp. NPDC049040]|uniref:hypothetical protein n=1 Tax=Streptomyces sp. NPDC049040 TaxID=3365593 RepID=UPI0037123503
MERIDEYFSRHLWLQFAVAWVVATGLVLAVFPGHSVLGVLIRVVLCSAVGIGSALRRRHREERAVGGTDSLLHLNHLLRKGEAPSDPRQRQAMRELVDRRLHRVRHRKAALVGMAVLLGGTTAMAASIASPVRSIAYGAYAAFFFVYLYFVGRLGITRLRRMRRMVADEDPGVGTAGASDESRRFAA